MVGIDRVGENHAEVVDDGCRLRGGERRRESVDIGVVRGDFGIQASTLLLIPRVRGGEPLLTVVLGSGMLSLGERELRLGSSQLLVVLALASEYLAHPGERWGLESARIRRGDGRGQWTRVERLVLGPSSEDR